MNNIILPENFIVKYHAAERFLERIILKESYTDVDIEVARAIISNILTQRALQYYRIDEYIIQIKHCNAVFIYDVSESSVITTYENKYEISRDKVEWIYKFPYPLHFKKGIDQKSQLNLIIKGFIPISKEGRLIIGQNDSILYFYDPRYNVIGLLSKKA